MGQQANTRRVKENEAMAMAKYIKTSPQKLDLIAQTIRGKDAGKALIDLEFNPRRTAEDVRKVLQSAVANAENNHGLDIDRLYVAEAYTGKSITMKRFRARARGRASKILKPFSRLTIVVREREDEAKAKKAPTKKVDVTKSAPKKEEAKDEKPKAETKKPEAKKETAKKAPAKKTATKKAPAKKTPAKKTAAKKTAAKKTTKKTAAKKTAAKKDDK